MLRTYIEIGALAARRAAKSWVAAVSIPIYAAIFVGASLVTARLDRLGGFLLALVGMACFAGYLYLVADAISGSKVRLRDMKQGMRNLWDVCSVSFALFIIGIGVSVLMRSAGPRAPAVAGVAQLAAIIFFNAVPELLYNSRSRSFALLKESIDFIMANPFAWFGPNLVFAAIVLAPAGLLSVSSPGELLARLSGVASPFAIAGLIASSPPWAWPLYIAFVHYVMVFRGLLFRELASGSSRQRAFRRRMGA
jgi:hypothetical protein